MKLALFRRVPGTSPPQTGPSPPPMQNVPHILLHEAFADQARREPNTMILQEGGRSVTCGELARQAARVRCLLQVEGIGPGARVALHAQRSIEAVAGMLGILEAGAAVLPVSPSDPKARVDEILRFADLGAVVDTASSPLPTSWAGPVIRSDGDQSVPAGCRRMPPPARTETDPPAFILRSSGSTGKPKLIVRSHGSFRHRLSWTWNRHPFQEGDVGCLKAHPATTHAIYELFEPLLTGTPVVILADQDVRNLERFWEIVAQRGVTRLLLVPSALRASLDLPGFSPPGLKVVVLMGEYVATELAARAIQTFPEETAIYSIYGSTEASSALCCNLRTAFEPGADLPLGIPLSPDVRVEVLDPSGRRVPEGASGRLHIGGTPLFREYFRDHGRTAAALVDREDGRGLLYDTRDDLRVEAAGRLVFLGRADDTVKVRGFRVALKEVEGALLRHPGVTQGVALAAGDAAASPRLDAWVVPASVDPAAVFETLRRHLPDYMVPSTVTPVTAFPLTASGKVDRRLLAEQIRSAPADPGGGWDSGSRTRDDAPDPRVHSVASAWEEVLGHQAFGMDQSFFEVGGTSLDVFRLVGALRSALGQDGEGLDEELVYRFPTVRALARVTGESNRGGPGKAENGQSPMLVTLRGASQSSLPPLFLLASSGGTVGVYERLARALKTPREIVGIRDPYLWGDRDPLIPMSAWARRYVEAMLSRQPDGPYHLGAYSSSGAFGFEVARQLRARGETVGLLVLVDPLGLDRPHDRSYGFWASRATYSHPVVRGLVRLVGRIRVPVVRLAGHRPARKPGGAIPNDHAPSADEVATLCREALASPSNTLVFSALLEMNMGCPVALDPDDLSREDGALPFQLLLERVAARAPELDARGLERSATQYPLQVWAQQRYRLQPLDVPTLLVEPRTSYGGLLSLVLRPHLRHLQSTLIRLGPPTPRVDHLSGRFGAWAPHFRCMRDETFVEGLARAIDARLEARVTGTG